MALLYLLCTYTAKCKVTKVGTTSEKKIITFKINEYLHLHTNKTKDETLYEIHIGKNNSDYSILYKNNNKSTIDKIYSMLNHNFNLETVAIKQEEVLLNFLQTIIHLAWSLCAKISFSS